MLRWENIVNALVRTILLILILGIPMSAYVPRRVASPAGLVLERWADSSFPVVWRLNPAVQGSSVSGGRSLAEVFRSSFQAWSSVATARVSFEEGAASAVTNAALDQVNLISVVPTQYGSDALSLTVIYSCTGSGADPAACAGKFPGQILEADILFNPAVTFSTDVSTPVSAVDLESRAMHEIGHLLGLDHSGLLSAVMFPAIPAGASHLRVLGSDDLIGISTMYPSGTFWSSRGSVRGVVRGSAAAPLYGAHVVIADATGRPVASTISDPDGMYEVGGLEPGNYSAYAEPLDNPLTPGAVPTLQAIYPGKTPVENFTTRFAVHAAQPESLTVAKTGGENQTGSIGEALSTPLEVEVRDGTGNLAAGVTVRFAATSGGGAVAPIQALTDSAGKARTTAYLGTGFTETFAASAGSAAVSFAATLRAPALTSMTPSSEIAGTSVTVTLAGKDFIRGATAVAVSGTGITVSSISVTSPTSLTATFLIDRTATLDSRSVTAITAAGPSNPLSFAVAKAASIAFLDPVSNAVIRELTVNEGKSIQARIRVIDGSGAIRSNVSVSYSSINPEVATVDTSGTIQGKKSGFSTLTVQGAGVVAAATVTVVQVEATASAIETTGVAQDLARRLYLAASQEHTILLAEDLGQTPQVYAGVSKTPGKKDDLRLQSWFKNPSFLAFNQTDGSLYVSDSANHVIRRVRPGAGGRVETFAGIGTAGSQDGPVATSSFNNPQGITLDNAGNLWVVDSGNHTIRKINLVTKTVETVAGQAGSPGTADGTGAQAQFSSPVGIAVLTESVSQNLERFRLAGRPPEITLIVADTGNGLLRRVKASGQVETLTVTASGVGLEPAKTWAANSAAVPMRFDSPTGVAVDASGNIYATEPGTGLVKTVLPSGEVVYAAQGDTFVGPKSVVVTQSGKVLVTSSNRSALEIRYAEPRITDVTPAKIGNGGGATVTIQGDNFATDTIVLLGGVLVPTVKVENTRTLSFVAPAVPSGLNTVTVQHRGGIAQRALLVEPMALSVLTAGQITTIAGGSTFLGDGLSAGAASVLAAGVAVDTEGNLFIADTANNRIRKVNAKSGIITTVAGNGEPRFAGDNGPATAAGLGFPFSVAIDAVGNLFIADTLNSRIRKVSAATGIITTAAGNGEFGFSGDGGPAASAALNAPVSVAVDAAGNLFISDSANHRIRRVAAANGVITTVAGNGWPDLYYGELDLAINASLSDPGGIAIDRDGNLFIADTSHNTVRGVNAQGFIITVAGIGSASFCGDGGSSTLACLNSPGGLAFDSDGNLFVADINNQRIRRIDAATGRITTVAGNGQEAFSGDNGPATSAALSSPTGIAVDGAGNLFIADLANLRIRTVGAKTAIISTLSGNGERGFPGDGGPGTAAAFSFPEGVAIDAAGNLFVADSDRVRKVDAATGLISTIAGTGKAGFSGDAGPASAAALKSPVGLAVDSARNLYIADSGNHRIRKVEVATGKMSTVAGSGQAGFSGDAGPASAAQLNFPLGIAVDRDNNLYIADSGNQRVRKVSATDGKITTAAGSGQLGFSGDNGPATAASLFLPIGVAVDQSGNLFIADTFNLRVRKVAAGTITTVAGNGQLPSNGSSGDNGPATSASLALPFGVAVDSAGVLFVADTFNSRVRRVAGGIITTVAGNGVMGSGGDNGPAVNASVFLPAAVVFDSTGNLHIADSGLISRIRAIRAPIP